MKKKIITITMALMMLMIPMAASAETHTHVYGTWKYIGTTQNGSYDHQYINGYIQGTTTPTYGTCTVCCETEHYQLKCNSCSSTTDRYKDVSYDCHGACGLGDVQTN